MQISMEMKASVPADVLIQELQGESVLLNMGTGRYFGLDEVGTRMWAVLTAAESLRTAYDTLLDEYDLDGQNLEGDLQNLVEKLVEHGLMEVRGG
jgi:Coenzyme PQQ synthesis protein D (PqqD)